MLDEVGQGVDHAGDDDLVGLERAGQIAILVGVARIGERQHEAANLGLLEDGQDVGERHVAVVRPLVVAPAHVQAHALARNIDQRAVDRRNHALDEIEKLLERPVLVRQVMLERQIRTVELQQEAALHDGVVLDLERIAERRQVGVLVLVVLVEHRRGDDAGRRCGQEWFGETRSCGIQRGAEVVALGFDQRAVEIADLADRLGRRHVGDRDRVGEPGLLRLLEQRIARDVAARPALPLATEPGHASAHVEEERLALLLAVVRDVDADLALLGDDAPHGVDAGARQRRLVDRLAVGAVDIEPHQLGRPRQAAGVGRQDARVAALHGSLHRKR